MKLFFDRRPITSIDEALHSYKHSEFESPTRSTIPLLSLLQHGEAIWKRVLQHFGLLDSSTEAHLEFAVPPPRGKGGPSQTDVMLINADRSVAIEAKWTEQRYEEVQVWLKNGEDVQNRLEVLSGWLSLLRPHASKELKTEDFGSAVYQMLHRAASACAAGTLPTLMYLQFFPLPDGSPVTSSLADDLRHLHSLLGTPDQFPFWLATVELHFHPDFEWIAAEPKGTLETAEMLRAALQNGPLFTLKGISFLPVKGTDSK